MAFQPLIRPVGLVRLSRIAARNLEFRVDTLGLDPLGDCRGAIQTRFWSGHARDFFGAFEAGKSRAAVTACLRAQRIDAPPQPSPS